jgi:hypothetical protein
MKVINPRGDRSLDQRFSHWHNNPREPEVNEIPEVGIRKYEIFS